MNFKLIALALISGFAFSNSLLSQPEITSWIVNTNGAKGYNSIPSNIQKVQYSTDFVYVSATCIPGYDIGPWKANPNTPSNQNFVFKFPRKPVKNTGNATKIPLGHTGVWSNGVSIYNAWDAQSYNNAGVWNRDAYFWEGISFDNCLGHPAQNGEYHHHVSPKCMYNSVDSSVHSPIIGFAFDGFPIYGAYAYTKTDGTGKITRMTSSYRLKTTSARVNGPSPDQTYPLGCFLEDFEYVAGYGTLDERNGRFCVTPDYPNGTYAYFVTIDENQKPVFPYTHYGTYYGVVTAGNMGPGSGHVTISEAVQTYNPQSSTVGTEKLSLKIFPNPVSEGKLHVYISNTSDNNYTLKLTNGLGQLVQSINNIQGNVEYTFNVTQFAAGIYTVTLESSGQMVYRDKIVVQ